MKTSRVLVAIASCSSSCSAFPELAARLSGDNVEAKRQVGNGPQGSGFPPAIPPPFDASSQYVSNQGTHQFVAPGSTDQRGECPGLNAMANHGYLPHNGVVTIQQATTACYQVFGLSEEVSGPLAAYAALVHGDGTSWSLGGTTHTGIAGSHSSYETDVSPMKGDLFQYGSNTRLIMSQFMNLYNRQSDPSTANYNLEVIRDFYSSRYHESVAKNPKMTYLIPGSGIAAAAHAFVYRLMANHTAQAPEGIVTKDTLKSFYSVTGPENNLQYTPGNERIPNNWYRRNPADQYTLSYASLDITALRQTDSQALNTPGCNQGRVNSFNSIDPSVISGGAYTLQTASQNPVCFIIQVAAAGGTSLLGIPAATVQQLQSSLNTLTSSLGACPVVTNPNFTQIKACPGFSNYGGPTAPVASGAIQS